MPLVTTHIATLKVEVAEPITIGETGEGLRRIVPITGGTIEGPHLNGHVLNAGADYQLIRADGYTTLDARYAIRLDDGTMIYVVNEGIRYGSQEVMDKITRGEPVAPEDVYFRTTPKFEVSNKDYAWLAKPVFVISGARRPDRVDMEIYQVE